MYFDDTETVFKGEYSDHLVPSAYETLASYQKQPLCHHEYVLPRAHPWGGRAPVHPVECRKKEADQGK